MQEGCEAARKKVSAIVVTATALDRLLPLDAWCRSLAYADLSTVRSLACCSHAGRALARAALENLRTLRFSPEHAAHMPSNVDFRSPCKPGTPYDDVGGAAVAGGASALDNSHRKMQQAQRKLRVGARHLDIITDRALHWALRGGMTAAYLRGVDLSGCRQLTTLGAAFELAPLPCLQQLVLNGCRGLEPTSLIRFLHVQPSVAATATATGRGGGAANPAAAAAGSSSGRRGALCALHLSGCVRLGAEVLLALARTAPQLALLEFGVSAAARVDSAALRALLAGCPQLEFLSLDGLKHHVGNPEVLALLHMPRVAAASVGAVAAAPVVRGTALSQSSPPAQLPPLHLSLRGCERVSLAWPFEPPHGTFRPLASLDLRCGIRRGVECGVLGRMAACGAMRTLRILDVGGCDRATVDDQLGAALATRAAPRLRALRARASAVGNGTLTALARGCPEIAQVDVAACFAVTDLGVQSLLTCRQLVDVCLENCAQLTWDAVGNFIASSATKQQPAFLAENSVEERASATAGQPGFTSVRGMQNELGFGENQDTMKVSPRRLLRLSLRGCSGMELTYDGRLCLDVLELLMVDLRGTRGAGRPIVECPGWAQAFAQHQTLQPAFSPHLPHLNGKHTPAATRALAAASREAGACTLVWTGTTPRWQECFSCLDCGLAGDACCCAACAKRCHAGHRLLPVPSWRKCYCDCALVGCDCRALPGRVYSYS